MRNRILFVVAGLGLVPVCALAQPAAAPGAPSAAGTSSRPAGVVNLKGVRVDLKNRTVALYATVCKPNYDLEFLLCQGEEKTYESLLSTPARPSLIHAGLLMLGLTPGKPARWAGGPEGKFLPPCGAQVTIAFRWKDKDGKAHTADAADWLATVGAEGKRPAPPRSWVFVGSLFYPSGAYAADQDGGIVCVANLPEAVIDVPFESANALENRAFRPNKAAIPPAGTAVEIVLTPLPGAEKAPDARVMLEIDRLGDLTLDGRPTVPSQLRAWAEAYIERHAKGQVVIRADGEATVNDVAAARRELEDGGVREFEEQFMPPDGPVLPRTAAQAKDALRAWADRLQKARALNSDAPDEAQAALDQIQPRIAEAQKRNELWELYRQQLRQSLDQYRASTRPARAP